MEFANVNYLQRTEFRSDPKRAIPLLEDALKRRNVRKPAAYALSRFRAGYFPPVAVPVEEETPAPTLELLELAWSWGMAEQGLTALAEAVARNGGFRALLTSVAHD